MFIFYDSNENINRMLLLNIHCCFSYFLFSFYTFAYGLYFAWIAEFFNDQEVAISVLQSGAHKECIALTEQISTTPASRAEWSKSVYDVIKKGNLAKV